MTDVVECVVNVIEGNGVVEVNGGTEKECGTGVVGYSTDVSVVECGGCVVVECRECVVVV